MHRGHDKLLEIVGTLPIALLQASGMEQVLDEVARRTMDVLGCMDCIIWLLDDSRSLIQAAAWGLEQPNGVVEDPLVLGPGEGVSGRAVATMKPQLVVDTTTDADYVHDVLQGRSEIAVPIISGGNVLGVIDSEHSEVGFFTDGDAELVSAIAAVAALRIEAVQVEERMADAMVELNQSRAQMHRFAHTDALTGAGNRRALTEQLSELVVHGAEFGLCVLDLDDFKTINDVLGHHRGDLILTAVADAVRSAFVDTDASLARVGGDEFVIIAPLDRQLFTSRILGLIDDFEEQVKSIRMPVKLSAGIAFGSDAESWRHADDALYIAKAAGGNQIRVYDETDDELVSLRRSRSWAETIRQSLDNGDLTLFAQKIAPAGAVGQWSPPMVELLLRYRGADGVWQSPAELLAAAALFGLDRRVDDWVQDRALTLLADPTKPLGSTAVCLNWSSRTIQSVDAVDTLIRQVHTRGVPPERLVIEVTEHVAIAAAESFGEAVAALRSAGIRVAIDDMGSGWTSLEVVRTCPIDFLKLDGAWVSRAVQDQLSRRVVEAMIESSRLLGARSVAESVEDRETLDLLVELGVDYVQGWHLHRPEPIESLVAALATDRS